MTSTLFILNDTPGLLGLTPITLRPCCSAIGIYRFWRDLGYGIGGLGLGIVAHSTGQINAAFWFVAQSMFLSGGLLWLLGEETHPRLASAP